MEIKPLGGAFLISRQLFNSEIWQTKPSSWNKIWIYILGKVNHSDNGIYKRGSGFFNFSEERRSIGKDITLDTVKKTFEYLKCCGMVSTTRSTKGMFVTVLKYNDFQSLENYSSTNQSTSKALPKHFQSTPINNNVIMKECNKDIYTPVFMEFWNIYPTRNGVKPGKKSAWRLFKLLTENDIKDLMLATKNYSEKGNPGFHKDAVRFLKDDYWRDWISINGIKQEIRMMSFQEDKNG